MEGQAVSARDESEALLSAFLASGGEVRRYERGEGLHLSRKQWGELSMATRKERPAVLSRHKPFDYLVVQASWGVLVGWDKRKGKHRFMRIPPTDERARRLYDEGAARRTVEAMAHERGCGHAVAVKVRDGEVVP